MAGDAEEAAATKTPEDRRRILDWLDVSAKLLGAVAVVVVAVAANGFQEKMNLLNLQNQDRITGLTLQSQREQAESQLRAAMFSSLIQPFVGAEKGSPIPVDREELLAQLLVLNFNEDFEAKPLMERVDARLAVERLPKWQSGSKPEDSRDTLRAIARRVADRQISALTWDWKHARSAERHGCEMYWLNVNSQPTGNETPAAAVTADCSLDRRFGDTVSIPSPDAKSNLTIYVNEPDWRNETVPISIAARANLVDEKETHEQLITYKFTLTWFDLPLTDNTILPNGDRFAINLRGVNPDKSVNLRVVWFPEEYFTVRERPLDSRRILHLLTTSEEQRKD